MISRLYVFAAAVAALLAQPILIAHAQSTAQPQDDIVQLDPARTNIDFTLLGNLHKTDGRFTLKSGIIRVDPETGNATGKIEIDVASEDSKEQLRDAIIRNGVLNVARYPEINFTPQKIQGIRDSQNNFYGQVTGLMEVQGSSHEMTVQVHGHLMGDRLTAASDFLVPYVEWGVGSPNVLSSTEIINSTREYETQTGDRMFPIFAHMLPVLRKIPPHLFNVSDLVQIKVETSGYITWVPEPQARKVTIIVPPR
jgi:polyisoprenoid-binding protein YceI